MIRQPALEGKFYPSSKQEVFELISAFDIKSNYKLPNTKKSVTGAVLPHAGHVYSGAQTIPFFQYLKKHDIVPDTFIIIHPNHSGNGARIAMDEHIAWSNCIGKVEIDIALSEKLPFKKDASVHKEEHSAEVIIPFIQYYFPNDPVKILPICVHRLQLSEVDNIAQSLNQAMKELNRHALVIASSDFSHFLTPEKGYQKDQLVLDKIKERDIPGLMETVVSNDISVCGYCPISTLMSYSALINKNYKTTIMARGHSGMIYPAHDVVDYISILFHG
ncbi:MAG TPA: AmmeMemoRadiSam system protein B [Bacteroidales bacterium]|nr:AmmeMemoRadiSam system protein B [Bacteroidales bacterium]